MRFFFFVYSINAILPRHLSQYRVFHLFERWNLPIDRKIKSRRSLVRRRSRKIKRARFFRDDEKNFLLFLLFHFCRGGDFLLDLQSGHIRGRVLGGEQKKLQRGGGDVGLSDESQLHDHSRCDPGRQQSGSRKATAGSVGR